VNLEDSSSTRMHAAIIWRIALLTVTLLPSFFQVRDINNFASCHDEAFNYRCYLRFGGCRLGGSPQEDDDEQEKV